jgi:hypothetical protein
MNLDDLQKKLIAAARANPPGGQVPYAFEKRITALVAARAPAADLPSWLGGLWRAAASCVAITLLFGAWALFNPAASSNPTADELSPNLENTLLASVDQNDQAQ